MSSTSLAVSADKKGELKVKWDKFRSRVKSSDAWKNAKYIEIQCSTDKDFMKEVKSKKILKGAVNKKEARTRLSKLKRDKTWYVRARLVDKKGVGSNWTKAVKIKAKN